MKNRGRFLGGFLIGFIAAALTSTVITAFGIWAFFTGRINPEADEKTAQNQTADSTEIDIDRINTKMNQIQGIIDANFLFEKDEKKIEDGIYAGLMNGLGDRYSVYFNAEDFAALNESTSGVYQGIGAMVNQDVNTGVIRLVKVFAGSPADEAGLKSGDILYKVDGIEVTGVELDVVVSKHIRGEEGTSVNITVLRGEEVEELEFVVFRREIEVPTVEYRIEEGNTGYISISQFDEVTGEQFKHAVDSLMGDGVEGIVIDLRDNPGGLLSEVVEMLDYILPDEGKLVYTKDKYGEGSEYYAEDGHQVDTKLAVLVNGNSASASELFTGAVKDYKRGTVVGTKTFGKGIVQNIIPLGDGTAIKITTEHYYTPSGFDLHGRGIEPNVEVELDKGAVIGGNDDNQLREAINIIKN